MKICIINDLKLTNTKSNIQYDILSFFVFEAMKRACNGIIFIGEENDTVLLQMKNCDIGYSFSSKTEIAEKYGITSLPSASADSTENEFPTVLIYDTETKKCEKIEYFCPVPLDFYGYIGISCYKAIRDIKFATEHNIGNIELRPQMLEENEYELLSAITEWKAKCGKNLSLHSPEIEVNKYGEIKIGVWNEFISFAAKLSPDRITVHVPLASVGQIKANEYLISKIADFILDKTKKLPEECVIGIENMHMTNGENDDDNRRFGYTPEECLLLVSTLRSMSKKRRVGINLDVGHAYNNFPVSLKNPLSEWYAKVGTETVSYHIYGVEDTENGLDNHKPITAFCGEKINFASFFKCFGNKKINKAPVILEFRRGEEYEKTLVLLEKERTKAPFDLHSHTYYSFCGKDEPHALINTFIENSVSTVGISDHNYGIGTRKAEYEKIIRSLADENKGKIRILCGIELMTVPGYYDLTSRDEIKSYDYCLLEHIDNHESFAYDDVFAFAESLGTRCGIPHTDLFAYCDKKGYSYDDFFKKLGESKIFWELNISYDSIHSYREHEYVKRFMQSREQQNIVKKYGVYMSVGFDGHRREDYSGKRVHDTTLWLRENGFRTADELFL